MKRHFSYEGNEQIWPKLLQVLCALGGKVSPKEEAVDSYLREERSWLVLLLCVEDFSEMKGNQWNYWQGGDDCPGETSKEVGVYEVTILGCLEEERARLTTQRKCTSSLEPVGLLCQWRR